MTGAEQAPPLVFLGPSLPLAEAQTLLTAEYCPPIRRGDLFVRAGAVPRTIGIVDGEFQQSLAVSPREILRALTRGHRVYGAASMGALRAVELGAAGMIGVGCIHAAYASGATERDDEVAVLFDPDTLRSLTEPLIGMRRALWEAAEVGLLTRAEARRAEAAAAAMHYTRRTYRAALRTLGLDAEREARTLAFLTDQATDLKAADARELLRRIAGVDRSLARAVSRPPPRRGRAVARVVLTELASAPKQLGTVRTVPAEQTGRVLAGVCARFGVTRVAEITQLDTLGVPCFSAILPGPGVSAYSGKGLTREEARIGAQLEALEAVLQYDSRVPMLRGTFADLSRDRRALDPERLPIVASERRDPRTLDLSWLPGCDLRTGEEVWVPGSAVFLDGPSPSPWHVSSNGFALGNTLTEALAHALAEVIERDALTIHRLSVVYGGPPSLLEYVAGEPRTPRPATLPEALPRDAYPFVLLDSLPAPLRATVDLIRAAGVGVQLRWVASEVGVPVFSCVLRQELGDGRLMTHAGSGAHPNAAVAAWRAVSEAAQSRATYIHGVREDLPLPAVHAKATRDWCDDETEQVAFVELPGVHLDDAREDVAFMVEALGHSGLDEVLVVDVSHPEIPLAALKVLVPGAEPPLELDAPAGPALGWRARRAVEALA